MSEGPPDRARLYELTIADGREVARRLRDQARQVEEEDPRTARFYRALARDISGVMDRAEEWLTESGLLPNDPGEDPEQAPR